MPDYFKIKIIYKIDKQMYIQNPLQYLYQIVKIKLFTKKKIEDLTNKLTYNYIKKNNKTKRHIL